MGRRPSGSVVGRAFSCRMRSLECASVRDAISVWSQLSMPCEAKREICQYMKPKTVSEAAPNSPRNNSASRKLVVRGISLSRTEDIARTPHGVDHLRRLVLFELATQPADMHVNDVCLRVIVIAPDLLKYHRPGNDAAGMPHQVF